MRLHSKGIQWKICVKGNYFDTFSPLITTHTRQQRFFEYHLSKQHPCKNIMSKGLGLSALVVFLSMALWGWVLGPTGMILSVPSTMVMQFFFAQYEETEWIALMLSDDEDEI